MISVAPAIKGLKYSARDCVNLFLKYPKAGGVFRRFQTGSRKILAAPGNLLAQPYVLVFQELNFPLQFPNSL